MDTAQRRRSLESAIANCRTREKELEGKIQVNLHRPPWAKRPSKLESRLDDTVTQRLAHEKELKSLVEVEQVEAAKLPRIFVVCVAHSRPGEPFLATMRHLDAENWVAICPACLDQGKELREKLNLEMAGEEVKIQ